MLWMKVIVGITKNRIKAEKWGKLGLCTFFGVYERKIFAHRTKSLTQCFQNCVLRSRRKASEEIVFENIWLHTFFRSLSGNISYFEGKLLAVSSKPHPTFIQDFFWFFLWITEISDFERYGYSMISKSFFSTSPKAVGEKFFEKTVIFFVHFGQKSSTNRRKTFRQFSRTCIVRVRDSNLEKNFIWKFFFPLFLWLWWANCQPLS